MSNIVSPLSYPKVIEFNKLPEFKGRMVYIIDWYDLDGISAIINRSKDDQVIITPSDFDGNLIDLSKESVFGSYFMIFMNNYSAKMIELMKYINLDKVQLYMTLDGDDVRLVDVRTSLNRFVSPGMLREVFGKVISSQKINKIINMTPETYDNIIEGKIYNNDLVFKSSRFMSVEKDGEHVPLYGIWKKHN